MPWCAGCDRFLSPNTVLADSTCPHCHTRVPDAAPISGAKTADTREADTPRAPVAPASPSPPAPNGAHAADHTAPEPAPDDEHTPIPWHLWLLIAAVVVYLGYRAFQGLELLVGF
jgi:hypothetical protein